MEADRVVRIFTFASPADEVLLDPALRDKVVPRLLEDSGIGSVHVGRRRREGIGERVIVSVWSAETVARQGIEARHIDAAGLLSGLADLHEEELALAVAVRGRATDPPSIVRVFRGRVRSTDLDVYLDEVRGGALADAAGNDGVVCVYLGARPPDRFVTVSIWTGWGPIEIATGGNIRDPMRTRNGQRIASHSVAHYEIIASGQRA